MLLDTDIFIEILRESPQALVWLANQANAPMLSGVAALETAFGVRSPAELRSVSRKRAEFTILWPTVADVEHAVVKFAALRLSHGIGSLDAVTAALALRHNIPIATFNVKHFRSVPGLMVIVPYNL